MPILKVANVHHDASGFARTQTVTANTITWFTGNAERKRLDPSGNLLINRTDSTVGLSVKLDVAGAINASAIYVNGGAVGGGGSYFQGNNGDVGSVSGLGDIFRVHSNTLSQNVTIYSGNNALCSGPLTISTGKTLTIQTGARVSIA